MLLPLLLALPWLVFPLVVALSLRRRPLLEEWQPLRGDAAPPVSIVVPARNEAHTIATCLGSLLQSEYPIFEVLVVDDGSEDETATIVAGFARRDPRVRLVTGAPLPPGWFGKPWACDQGAREAGAEYLLFTDADVVHGPELLGRCMRALLTEDAALLSVLPHQHLPTFWERLVMPHVLLLILLRYPDPARVNAATRTRDKIANGQFILVRHDAYEAVGGHAAVRHEVAEDLRLAHAFHAAGFRVFLAVAERFMAVRMYRSLREIVAGWSKNVAIASRQTVAPPLRPLVPWLIGSLVAGLWLLPPAVLLLATAGVLGGGVLAWSAVACAASLAFWAGMCRRLRVPLAYALLYPAGACVAAVIFFTSALRGGSVRWKGRAYRATASEVSGA